MTKALPRLKRIFPNKEIIIEMNNQKLKMLKNPFKRTIIASLVTAFAFIIGADQSLAQNIFDSKVTDKLALNRSYQIATDIKGQVLDAATGEALIGATVLIKDSTKGASTDLDGNFIIRNVEDGSYTLLIRYLGYQEQEVNITIQDGQYEALVFNLMPIALTGEDVLVYGQAIGQVKAINQQRESDAIVNIVSEEKMRELPDVNAAEAIGRLPGIALQRNNGEGQKVIIRGLDPKYTNITINGVKVPSNSGSNKSVDLSMISTEALAGIEVYKSPTPDMDADAIGGTVNLVLREAPNVNTSKLSLEGAYNGLKSTFGNYKASANLSRRYLDQKLGVILQGNVEGIERSSNDFGGGYQILEDIQPLNFNLSDQIEFRTRSSFNLNLDYRLKNGNLALYSYYASTGRDMESRNENYRPIEDNIVQYSMSVSEREISLLTNMVSGEHNWKGIDIDWSTSFSRTKGESPGSYYMLFEDIEAYSHDPILNDVPMAQWVDSARTDFSRSRLRNGSFNTGSQIEDNLTALINIEIPLSQGFIESSFKMGAKAQRMGREKDDATLAETFYYLGGLEMRTAIDLWQETNDALSLTPDGRIALNNFIGSNPYEVGTFLGGDYRMTNPLSAGLIKNWIDTQKEILHIDRYGLEDNYLYDENIDAYYGMINVNVGNYVKIISGVRFEDTFNDMTAKYSRLQERYGQQGTIDDTTRTKSYKEIMPHLHVKIQPVDWFDLRLSYAQTLARPDYNMVIPKANINAERSRITAGNPELKHMTADNYDITATFFSPKLGLLSVSGFYKELKNIFFPVSGLYLASDSLAAVWGFPSRAGYDLTSYDNSPEAMVRGIEVDLQTNLSALDSPLSGVVLSLNVTRQFSETTKYNFTTEDSLVGFVRGRPVFEKFVVKKTREIDMPGQPPLIFNLSIGYDLKGFSGRISGNYQSDYLVGAGQSEIQDTNSGEFWRWDLALKQKINDNLVAHFSISNLTGMREQTYRNYEQRYPRSISHYGAITNFGIRYTF